MSKVEDEMLAELKEISSQLQHLDHIREGEYEPPRGVDFKHSKREPRATPDDIYHMLSSVVGLLERQNTMIYNVGRVICEANEFSENYWRDLNSR